VRILAAYPARGAGLTDLRYEIGVDIVNSVVIVSGFRQRIDLPDLGS
jgi:hypothetical protein